MPLFLSFVRPNSSQLLLRSSSRPSSAICNKPLAGARLFHSHTTVRPNFNRNGLKSSLRSASGLLWSYFKAPSNLLFISTNLLGLGIIASYRGLSTLSKQETKESKHSQNYTERSPYYALEWDFTANNFLPNRLKKKTSAILSSIDEEAFSISDSISKGNNEWNKMATEFVSEGSFIDQSEGLPLTEMDLNELGAPTSRNIASEKSKSNLVNYLLMINYFYGSLSGIFGEKLCLDTEEIKSLPESYKETLLKTLMRHTEKNSFTTFSEFIDTLPSKDVGVAVASYSASGIKNQLLKRSHESDSIDYNYLENNKLKAVSHVNFATAFDALIKKYRCIYTLKSEFFLDMADVFIRSNNLHIDYDYLLAKLSEVPNNANFNTLSNVLGIHLIKQKNEHIIEPILVKLLRSSSLVYNKSLFDQCILNLNFMRERKANKRIRKMAQGYNIESLSYSLETYITALEGLMRFHPDDDKLICDATQRIIYGLNFKKKNEQIRVNYWVPKDKTPQDIDQRVWEYIPKRAIDTFMKVGVNFRNGSLIRSTIAMMRRSKNITDDLYITMLEDLEEKIIPFEDKELTDLVQHLKSLPEPK